MMFLSFRKMILLILRTNYETQFQNHTCYFHLFSALFEYVYIDDLIELTLTEVINRVWYMWIYPSLSKEDYDYLQFLSSDHNTIQDKGIFTRLIRKGLMLGHRDSK